MFCHLINKLENKQHIFFHGECVMNIISCVTFTESACVCQIRVCVKCVWECVCVKCVYMCVSVCVSVCVWVMQSIPTSNFSLARSLTRDLFSPIINFQQFSFPHPTPWLNKSHHIFPYFTSLYVERYKERGREKRYKMW